MSDRRLAAANELSNIPGMVRNVVQVVVGRNWLNSRESTKQGTIELCASCCFKLSTNTATVALAQVEWMAFANVVDGRGDLGEFL
jgi:hypothetical protein